MSNTIIKEARIVKRKGKYCVIGHKKDKNGKYRNFGCYDTKEDAQERLGQIYMFKHKAEEIIHALHTVSGTLYDLGVIHIADALTGCINSIIREESQQDIVVKLEKISGLLLKKGKQDLADQLSGILPEVLSLEKVGCDEIGIAKHRISSQRAYNIASLLKKKYLEGEINETDFEYAKMQELEVLLKAGFIFPMPHGYKELPTDTDNWWDHFSKRGK